MPELYSVHDVFGVSRGIPANYVRREEVDAVFLDALAQNKHVVVHGSSKQGKTSLRKQILPDPERILVICRRGWNLGDLHTAILKAAGYVVEGTTTRTTGGGFKIRAEVKAGIKLPLVGELGGGGGTDMDHQEGLTVEGRSLELDPADVNDVIAGLQANGAPKFIVLDDFHYLPEDAQQDFAVALKAFHESSDFTFVIVGVWLDENRLTQFNGDLVGRVISINVDKWDSEHLARVIHGGGELLGIVFDERFSSTLVSQALESVWIVQETCRLACIADEVFETQQAERTVTGDVGALVKQVVDSDSARFNGFLTRFAAGFDETEMELHKWLLYAVINAESEVLRAGLSYAQVWQEIADSHPQGELSVDGLDQALRSTAELQIVRLGLSPLILDYDPTARRLAVVDRTFLVWLRHQIRDELLDHISIS
ncbi:hypothetical protein ACEYYH_14360 [Microbacterium trichothecenolyticum]|uniref:hypothetical protein n=1 Tax=Microbacterium trichothecenolyticum TaxID=69370 RepID=UPI0035BE7267